MKTIRLSLIIFLCSVSALASGQVSFGKAEKLNEGWRFILNDVENAGDAAFDDSRWQAIDLPHDWSVKLQLSPTLSSATGYLPGGIGWYRKVLELPKEKQGQKKYLYFEGVYNRSEVFVNGQSLGKRPNGYISFLYDATPYLSFGEKNVIAVRVDHSRSADSRWYTGSGIYRNVWLVTANPVHIAQWGVYAYPSVSAEKQGVLHVEVEIENGLPLPTTLTVVNELLDGNEKVVAKSSENLNVNTDTTGKIVMNLKVKNPHLWNLSDPYLYRLKTTILQDGREVDASSTQTGFRAFAFDPDKGFALNGTWMKLKGVCLHHDAGVLGSAVPREVWKRRLLSLKEIGCNAIRTSHNPQAPDLYELCDEIGLLVMDEAFDEWEFPKRKWLEGWNVGTPGFQGSYDFFEEWGEKDLADMVLRDRNHLSVFAWSIGNEVDYPNDPYSHPVLDGDGSFSQPIYGGYKKDAPDGMRLGTIAKRLVAVVKKYDRSRPVTAGLAGVTMSNETEYPDALDITGYNYTEGKYDSDHEKYPERVIYGSENGHSLSAWKAVTEREFIFGQFLWTGIDYLGESGRWPSRGFYSGLLDFGGFIKPRGYFRQSLWSDKPMAYLGTYPARKEDAPSMDAWAIWNYEEGRLIRVVCYTNSARAKLLLNGKQVGEIKGYDPGMGIISWDVPFQSGTLEVAGLDQADHEICNYTLQSSGRSYALKIAQGDSVVTKNGIGLVAVQVVDENGIPVMLSDDELTCHITGPATLAGLEAGNNHDMSDYTDRVQRVFHGRILAYVKVEGKAGEVTVKFTAPWLKQAETKIQIK